PALLRVHQATLLFLLRGRLLPLFPNDPVFLFDTLLPVTLFRPSAFFLTLLEILFSVNPSAECGLHVPPVIFMSISSPITAGGSQELDGQWLEEIASYGPPDLLLTPCLG